jgi:hypothetical protein
MARAKNTRIVKLVSWMDGKLFSLGQNYSDCESSKGSRKKYVRHLTGKDDVVFAREIELAMELSLDRANVEAEDCPST